MNAKTKDSILSTAGITLVRVCVGVFLVYHGFELFDSSIVNKYLSWEVFKTPYGKELVYVGKSLELFAGLLFVLGLFTRLACVLIIGVMGYISFFVGKGIIWYDDQHPFLFVLIAILFLITGPGKWSLDKFLLTKK